MKPSPTILDLNFNPPPFTADDSPPSNDDTPLKQQAPAVLAEKLNRISSENQNLNRMLGVVFENYIVLRNQVYDLMIKSRKRKARCDNCDFFNRSGSGADAFNDQYCGCCSDDDSCRKMTRESSKPKTTRVLVPTPISDSSLVVKDGYQWRKYGQKVTKDNLSPRAYYKCSFAPSCPVKRKVQRSAENSSYLVATYQGEHNHMKPSSGIEYQLVRSIPLSTQLDSSISSPSWSSVDLTKSNKSIAPELEFRPLASIQQNLFQKMASALTSNPDFTRDLVTAITGSMVDKGSFILPSFRDGYCNLE